MSKKKKGRTLGPLESFFEKHYKLLVFIPTFLGILSLAFLGFQYATTGEFIQRGISLKGGTTITVSVDHDWDIGAVESTLSDQFPGTSFSARELTQGGRSTGLVIESDIPQEQSDAVISTVREISPAGADIGAEQIGSSLGASFFREAMVTLLIAFFLMGVVVYVTFRSFVPSLCIMLAALFDIIITLAIINIMGIKLSTGGFASLLMLIGFSIDTDILLTTRVLRRGEEDVLSAIRGAFLTGMTMSAAGIGSITVAFIFASSPMLKQILLIIIIGLVVDVMTTWAQNAGLLRWFEGKWDQ